MENGSSRTVLRERASEEKVHVYPGPAGRISTEWSVFAARKDQASRRDLVCSSALGARTADGIPDATFDGPCRSRWNFSRWLWGSKHRRLDEGCLTEPDLDYPPTLPLVMHNLWWSIQTPHCALPGLLRCRRGRFRRHVCACVVVSSRVLP